MTVSFRVLRTPKSDKIFNLMKVVTISVYGRRRRRSGPFCKSKHTNRVVFCPLRDLVGSCWRSSHATFAVPLMLCCSMVILAARVRCCTCPVVDLVLAIRVPAASCPHWMSSSIEVLAPIWVERCETCIQLFRHTPPPRPNTGVIPRSTWESAVT